MSHVYARNSRVQPPKAIAGEGCYLIDDTGKRYLDASGGAAVSCLGHGDQTVTQAIKDQLDQLAFAHTGFFTSGPAEALADLLIANAPTGIERVYFVSGGSEAVEAALKLARQFHIENGDDSRHRVIARRQSYHGNTLGALAAGGNAWRKKPFQPMLGEAHHIMPCYEYRDRADGESLEAFGLRAADALATAIERLGPETVSAFIAEPVVGATLGAVPAAPGYFQRIREICNRYGVLLILDEVMCGMGRTGTLFACEADGIAPDIVTIAKGLGGGYQPIGATLCKATIHDTIAAGSGFFQHGHTYLGHPAACAAGLAVVTSLLERDLVARSAQMGTRLGDRLRAVFGQHPNIGDIRGRGLFAGVEIVEDQATKAPFDPAHAVAKTLKAAAMDEGLVCYPMGGTVDGIHGDHVLLAPPFIIEDAQLDELTDKLGRALSRALPA